VRDVDLGRIVRALRRRRRWRQADCARLAGIHRSTWSLLERGHLDGMTLETLRRCLDAIGVRLDLVPRWRGAELDRLLDENHSRLAATLQRRLSRWAWAARSEVSFNHYGDRGRVDILAWHPGTRVILIVEVKTEIADVQALLGSLDVKRRLGATLAREAGWPRPEAVATMLVVAEGATNRRRIKRVEALFAQFDRRGRSALSWLRRPNSTPEAMILFSSQSSARGGRVIRGGASRVRVSGGRASVEQAGLGATHAAGPG
jgi:transcriptional regulator with XRE-family HTH domain